MVALGLAWALLWQWLCQAQTVSTRPLLLPPPLPPPLSCGSWTTGSCLSWHDGKVGQFRNVTGPEGCCHACNHESKCRAWAFYNGREANGTKYCDLYASDEPIRTPCEQGITSNPSQPPRPSPPSPNPIPPPPRPKPGTIQHDVLMIVVDDLRYQFGFEGPGVRGPGCAKPSGTDERFFPGCSKMHTPSLDQLVASPGTTVFARNYVQQAVCAASRASVLTSRRPDATNWGGGYWRSTAGNWSTLPEAFRRSGYWTHGCGKIFHGGPHSGGVVDGIRLATDDAGLGPGTYSWSAPYFHATAAMKHYPYGDCKSTEDSTCSVKTWRAVPAAEEAEHPLEGTVLANHAIATLNNISAARALAGSDSAGVGGSRFFLGVGFHRPHLPFVFPAAKLDLYPRQEITLPQNPEPPVGMPAVAWSNWVSIEAKSYADINRLANLSAPNASGYDGRALGLPGVQLPEQQQVDMRRAYYSAVSHTDEQIGRVLESLTATGLRKSTVVCVFADHGWSIGEHGKWEKHTNFELDVHAPWILSLPPAGSASTQPVTTYTPNKVVHLYTEHVDIFPTLLEAAAGVVIPSCGIGSTTNLCTMGRSRVPLLDGAQQPLSAAAADRLTVSSDNAAFSQYARPYAGRNGSTPVLSTSWCMMGKGQGGNPACTVGYTMVGLYFSSVGPQGSVAGISSAGGGDSKDESSAGLDGEYRYTEWVGFNTPGFPYRPDWSDNAGTELYRHLGSSIELVNLANHPQYEAVRQEFSRRLHSGPTTGGGWGFEKL